MGGPSGVLVGTNMDDNLTTSQNKQRFTKIKHAMNHSVCTDP